MSIGLTSSSQQTVVNGAINMSIPTGATRIAQGLYHSYGAAGLADIKTPTASKTMYITDIFIGSSALLSGLKIGDNVTTGFTADTLYTGVFAVCPANGFVWLHFDTPLAVATKLNAYAPAAAVVYFGFVGWEI